MRVKIRKVGNSLTVTIPKEIAMDLGIGPDVEMDVSAREGTLVLQPVASRWDRLVAEVRAQTVQRNLTDQDVDRGLAEARGRDA
jgi:antitoxin component of MazEF toxin-antitoxin module